MKTKTITIDGTGRTVLRIPADTPVDIIESDGGLSLLFKTDPDDEAAK
jgi:hypothetical protein